MLHDWQIIALCRRDVEKFGAFKTCLLVLCLVHNRPSSVCQLGTFSILQQKQRNRIHWISIVSSFLLENGEAPKWIDSGQPVVVEIHDQKIWLKCAEFREPPTEGNNLLNHAE